MASHHLQDEGTRVRERGRVDVVDGLANPVKGSRRADCEVGHGHVVVNGSYQTHNLQMSVVRCLFLCNLVLLAQLGYKLGPFRAEYVCTGERAITTAYNERIDSLLDHVVRRSEASFPGSEGSGTCRSNQGTTLGLL